MKKISSDLRPQLGVASGNTPWERQILWIVLLIAVIAGSLVSVPADARPIRFDFGTWSDPSGDLNASLGFNFNLFGASSSIATIDTSGNITFGGATIQAFDSALSFPIMWQTTNTNPPCTPDPLTCDPFSVPGVDSGIRICWGCDGTNNSPDPDPNAPIDTSVFELGLFDLGGNQFVIELNYNGLFDEGQDEMFLGYDNGLGQSFDLLDSLSLPLTEIYGINDDCAITPNALACVPLSASGFGPGSLPDYFLGNNGGGRYLILIDNAAMPVPEPGTALLLMSGLAAFGALRSRRRRNGLRGPSANVD